MVAVVLECLALTLTLILSFSSSSYAVARHATVTSATTTTARPHGGNGTNWAVLVAGSRGYENYRHQADVCHAYQILKRGGIKDEHIVVFMYDDVANDDENPRKGTLINHPRGPDVYKGVPKDYTGEAVTANNLLAVILGDKKKVKGGSKKVVRSGPKDNIFIYYTDHGSPGVLGMPAEDDQLFADELVNALKKKHAAKSYNRMVIYMEACESGSMFDGLLPTGLNIYVNTASNPNESSFATYCPEDDPSVPKVFETCLGDLYSVSWMENSERHDPRTETLGAQYLMVRKRTISVKDMGSHVMQYGDSKVISKDAVGNYIGFSSSGRKRDGGDMVPRVTVVDQRQADILYLRQKVRRAPEGSKQKAEAQQKLNDELAHRKYVDESIAKISQILFGDQHGPRVTKMVRPQGQPLVDDWDCLKSLAGIYKAYCGSLATYGMKYMRAFANMCNAGVEQERMAKASSQACKP